MRKSMGLCLLCVVAAAGCQQHHAMIEPDASFAGAGLLASTEALRLAPGATPSGPDARIAADLDKPVSLRLPTPLAIVKLKKEWQDVSVEMIDATELKAWEQVVAGERRITAVMPIPPVAITYEVDEYGRSKPVTLTTLRQAAARQKCELLLVYLQADSQVENLNPAAALYWTGVGLFVVPGTEVQHKTVMQAMLIDCRTGTILGTATGDSHRKGITPAAMVGIQHDQLSKRTPVESLKDLQSGCKDLITNVVSRMQRASAGEIAGERYATAVNVRGE